MLLGSGTKIYLILSEGKAGRWFSQGAAEVSEMCLANKAPVGLGEADTEMQPLYAALRLSYFNFLSLLIRRLGITKNRSFNGYHTLKNPQLSQEMGKKIHKAPQSVQPLTKEIQKQSTKHLKVSLKNLMENS